MLRLRAVLSRYRGGLIYTAICLALVLPLRDRTYQHLTALNGGEWSPIQAFVRANRHGDEPLCFLPTWTFGSATDLYGFRGIDVVRTPEEAYRGRDEPASGLWVVSQFDAFDEASVPRELYPHRDHVNIGGAEIWVFRQQPRPLLATLALRLPEARCALQEPRSKRLEFVWKRSGFVAPFDAPNRERYSYLGCRVVEERFAGRTRMGLWFHPPAPGSSLSLVWDRLELHPWLAVSGGLRDAIANRRGQPVSLVVTLNGKTLRNLTFPVERGWKTFAVELGEAGRGEGRLGFRVSAKNNHSLHFVFDASFEDVRPIESGEPAKTAPRPRRGPSARGLRPSAGAEHRRDLRGGDEAVGEASPPDEDPGPDDDGEPDRDN